MVQITLLLVLLLRIKYLLCDFILQSDKIRDDKVKPFPYFIKSMVVHSLIHGVSSGVLIYGLTLFTFGVDWKVSLLVLVIDTIIHFIVDRVGIWLRTVGGSEFIQRMYYGIVQTLHVTNELFLIYIFTLLYHQAIFLKLAGSL